VGSLKSLAQGLLFGTGLVWLFNVVALIRGGDAWLGMAYLLIMLLPVTTIALLKLSSANRLPLAEHINWRNLMFAFQGVALAFWMLDLITTFYAIDVTGLAIELNPLGWPLGILGALAFYGPALVFSYVLLFRLKERISLYAAIPLTLVTLSMSLQNLIAGAQNFQVFVHTASLSPSLVVGLLPLLVVLNVSVPLMLKRKLTQPNLAL
jgi:hypothetical protein